MLKAHKMLKIFLLFLLGSIETPLPLFGAGKQHGKKKSGRTQLHTPVLFMIFKRPAIQALVFEQIRAVQPKQLFIAADGPRMHVKGEYEKCMAAREIIKQVDWPCEVKTLFRDTNLGCGRAVSSAITWFFSYVDRGIILEDDCLPNKSFFYFCQEMLNKYATNENIFHINGIFHGTTKKPAGYFFNYFISPWGWATWKRAWQHFDYDMKNLDKLYASGRLEKTFDPDLIKVLKWHLEGARNGHNIWAVRWNYSVINNNGLVINPTINLIQNVGFDVDSTNSVDPNDPRAKIVAQEMDIKKLVHPQKIPLHPGTHSSITK